MNEETLRIRETDIAQFLDIDVKEIGEEYLDYVGTWTIKSWTFGERERIIGTSSTQIVDDNGKIKSTLDSSIFRLAVMSTCIKDCPLKSKPTMNYLDQMPVWLGEALWDKVNELNDKLGKDEAKKFKFS